MLRSFLILCLFIPLYAADPTPDVLDCPVPWSGTIRKTTLKELIARMTGWAEGTTHADFKLAQPLPPDLANNPIDRLDIKTDPSPTYRDLIESAFKTCGESVAISRGADGIVITRVFTRNFRISQTSRTALRSRGHLNPPGFIAEMSQRGYKTSNILIINFLENETILIARGTVTDLTYIERFLGL